MNYLKIFEAYVLRIISLFLLLLGITYLLNRDWAIGIFVIIVDVLVLGGIGQSLKHNQSKTLPELLSGQDLNFKEGSTSEALSQEESRKIAKPFLYTNWTLTIISVIILFHQNQRFYIAIPLGFLIGMLLPALLYMLGVFITKKVRS